MGQIIISTGNIANDGTGAPLRTAFTETNYNFTQLFAAGPTGSNITIANNTIQVTNTNGNLQLATNGIGVVVPSANFVPDVPNVRSIGLGTNRFSTVYSQYINAATGTFSGNVYVAGNLQVTGNVVTVDYSNLSVANSNITLATGAANAAQANGGGVLIPVANANLTYNYSANSWNSTIAVTAPTFIGDGANLTNVIANVQAINVLGSVLSDSVNYSNLTNFGLVATISATGDVSTTGNVYANVVSANSVTANYLAGNGSNITNITANAIVGNVPFALVANTAYVANLAALATQAINADTALFAINANLASWANTATIAQTANASHYAIQADNANSAVVAGMAYELAPTANLSVTGNITTGGYFIGDGGLLSNISGAIGSYGNSNVAAYLPSDITIIGIQSNIANTDSNVANLTTSLANTDSNVANNASNITILQGQVYANSNVESYLQVLTTDISTSGNVTANYFIGDGGLLSNIVVTTSYGNSNVAEYLPTDITIIGIQSNIANTDSNVANLVTITTNTDSNVANLVTITTNTDSNVANNASNIATLQGQVYANSNVESYLQVLTTDISTTGNIIANNISVSTFSSSGNILSNSLTSTGVVYAGIDGQLTTNNSMTFADVGGEMTLTVDYFSTSTVFTNDILGSGNSINVSAQYGNSVLFDTTGGISATGNVTAANFTTSGSQGNITGANVISAVTFSASGNITASTANVGAIDVSGTIAWPDTSNVFVDSGLHIYGNLGLDMSSPSNVAIIANANTWRFGTDGTLTVPGAVNHYVANTSTPFSINSWQDIQLTTGDGVNTGYQNWSFGADGNLNAPGNISAVGNITADYFIGDGSQLTNLPIQPGTYSNSNVESLLSAFGTNTISTTGNVSGGSFTLAGDTILNNVTNTITLQTGGDSWTFGTDGKLTLPGGGTITSALGSPEQGLWLGYNGHRLLLNNDGQFWTGGIELGGNALPGYVGSYGNITLNANIGTDPLEKQWVFGTDGNLSIPGGGAVWTLGSGTAGLTANIADPYQVNLGLDYASNTATLNANNSVYIQTNSGNTQWAFLANSLMTAPGAISAVGNISAGNISVSGNVLATNIVAEASFSIQTANFNAVFGGRYGVDTTGGAVTATLPAPPPTGTGMAVFFADAGGAYSTNNLIINPNGGTIMGASGNLTVSTNNQSVGLFYNGATWRTYNAG